MPGQLLTNLVDFDSQPLAATNISASILQSGSEYRAFGAPSLFGQDVIEFVIKPESVSDRHWEGDQAGQLVTYRSMAGEADELLQVFFCCVLSSWSPG